MLKNEVSKNSFSFSENGNFVIFFVLGPIGSSGAETRGGSVISCALKDAPNERAWGVDSSGKVGNSSIFSILLF